MKKPLTPPTPAIVLLKLALPDEARESIIGDMEEEMHAIADRGVYRAHIWFLWQSAIIASRFIISRFLDRRDGRLLTNPQNTRNELAQSRTKIEKGSEIMSSLWQDLRFGLRLLWKAPGFMAVAVISLALGIGANAAIFQLINAVRLRSLPVANPQELAEVKTTDTENRSGDFTSSHPTMTNPQWEWIRDHQESFSGMFAWSDRYINLAQSGEVRFARGLMVSGDFFSVLGVKPVLGRVLTAADDRRGCGAPGVVISHPFWQREYGGASIAIGSKLTLDGHPFEIIGVTEPSFTGLEVGQSFDLAAPLCSEALIRGEYSRLDMRDGWWLTIMGRLKPGASLDRATAQLAVLSPALFQETLPPNYSSEDRQFYLDFKLGAFAAGAGVSNLRERYQDSLSLLLAIAGLVLLIACANLANLMLARASAREREIAVRLALGASRGRLIRQLLVECLLLAVIGATFGTFLAQGLSRFLISLISQEGSSLFLDLSLDWRLLGFMGGLVVLTSLLFGLAPAFRVTRTMPGAVLKAGGRGLTASREKYSLRRLLVVSQVALSFVLLFGALLFVRTLQNVMSVDPGFTQEGVVIATVNLRNLKLPKERRQEYKRDLLERVRALPGVESAANLMCPPLSGCGWNSIVQTLGVEPMRRSESHFNQVSPGYFKTLKANLLAGRDFDQRDTLTSPKVAIVNETFARRFFDGANPLGKRFEVGPGTGNPPNVYEIIGLVKDTKYRTMREDFRPTAFVAEAQDRNPNTVVRLIIRSSLSASALTTAVKQTILESSPEVNLSFRVFKTQIMDGLMRERLMATLSGFFGLLAVLLAMVGLYGVLSYTVAQRRNEIGVRMALGANRFRIIKLIMRDAGAQLIIGLVIGGVLAVLAARSARAMLYGLEPGDPLTIGLAIALLGAVGLIASYLPARRAARQDPMNALREE
jgi:putative ABC transport system permease protein